MSFCSSWVVAGSTMSAYLAVSVRKCSLTTVKRSSRDNPSSSFSCSLTIAIGLALYTNSDLTGGSSASSPVKAAPRRQELITRIFAGCRLRTHQNRPVDGKRPDRKLQEAATDVPPRTDQGGQASNRTHGLSAAGMALNCDADPDDRRRGGRIFTCELENVIDGNARLGGGKLRRVGLRPALRVHRSRAYACRYSRDQ